MLCCDSNLNDGETVTLGSEAGTAANETECDRPSKLVMTQGPAARVLQLDCEPTATGDSKCAASGNGSEVASELVRVGAAPKHVGLDGEEVAHIRSSQYALDLALVFTEDAHLRDPMETIDRSDWGTLRNSLFLLLVGKVRGIPAFDTCITFVIFCNIGVMAVETDQYAECVMSSPTGEPTDDCQTDDWLLGVNCVLLAIYVAECLVRLFVQRRAYIRSMWNFLDFVVVFIGILGFIFSDANLPTRQINMLRIFRIARVVRVLKVIRNIPTLWHLISGLLGALYTMIWGVILIMVLLLIWSIVAVETVHPTAWRVFENEPEPVWCRTAFSTVLRSTFYFFVTLVAMDQWGTCAIPIVQESPATFIVFAATLFMVQLGFTNLVLAIIVDKAAEARESTKEEKAEQAKRKQKESFEQWAEVMRGLDTDNSGSISAEELLAGYEDISVRQMLDDIGITRNDLLLLFKLMDADDSGTLSFTEFIGSLAKAQVQNPKVYLMTLQLRVQKIEVIVTEKLDKHLMALDQRFNTLAADSGLRLFTRDSTDSLGNVKVIQPEKARTSVSPARPLLALDDSAPNDVAAELEALASSLNSRLDAAIAFAERAERAAEVAARAQAGILETLKGASGPRASQALAAAEAALPSLGDLADRQGESDETLSI